MSTKKSFNDKHFSEEEMKAMGARLRVARKSLRFRSAAVFGKTLGYGQAAMSDMESGKVVPEEKFLISLESKYKIRSRWIKYGEEPRHLDTRDAFPPSHVNVLLFGEWADKPSIAIEDYFAAPLVDGKIAAGPGREISEHDTRSYVWIYAPAIKDRVRHRISAVEIEHGKAGESMKPTLEPGDIVLIDHDDPGPMSSSDAIRDGKIYAIRTDPTNPGCAIKRLYKIKDGILIVSDNAKDNPPKTSWTADHRELIIGRVVWGWRNLLDV